MSVLRTIWSRYAGRANGTLAGIALSFLNAVLGDGDPATVGTAVETALLLGVTYVGGWATEAAAISRRTTNRAIDQAKEHIDEYVPGDQRAQLDQLDRTLRDALIGAYRASVEDQLRAVTGVKADQR